jgi:two-component system sensor kinase FixL
MHVIDAGISDKVNASSVWAAHDLSPEELRETLDEAGICTWSLDPATGVVVASETCQQVFGVPRSQLSDYGAILALIHPDDRPARAEIINQALREGGVYQFDCRVLCAGDGVRWLRSRGRVQLGASGRPLWLRGVVFSIDDQKRAEAALREHEEHLRSILQTLPEAAMVIDAKNLIRSFSPKAERLFCYKAREVVGRPMTILIPGYAREPTKRRHRPKRAEGGRAAKAAGTLTAFKRDGSSFPVELSVGAISSEAEVLFTLLVNDVTEQEKAEAQLQELQAELIHVSRLSAMGEMASALAHELNQPLCAVSSLTGACELILARDGADAVPRARAVLKEAAEQVLRAGQIVRRLRDFVLRGDLERRLEPVLDLMIDAASLALAGAKEQGVSVRFSHDPKAKLILVDRVQIQQVLVNLMRNAREAMLQAARRELTLTTEAIEDQMVRITVSDTGPGIPGEIADRLFETFVTTKPTGMGVGLPISLTIVEAHGGKLWVEDNEAGGATFRFTLPVMSDGDATDAT